MESKSKLFYLPHYLLIVLYVEPKIKHLPKDIAILHSLLFLFSFSDNPVLIIKKKTYKEHMKFTYCGVSVH